MTKQNYLIKGMTCAACANSVESILTSQKGVDTAAVNFAANSVLVSFDEEVIKVPQLQKAVSEIGYELVLSTIDPEVQRKELKKAFDKQRMKFFVALSFSIPVFIISMFMLPVPHSPWVQMLLSIPVLFYSGVHFYINAFKKARHLTFTMDTLIALGTGVAFLFSLFNTIFPEILLQNGLEAHIYYESAVVIITLILLGNLLEERAKQKTSGAIENLIRLQPDEATILFINKPTIVNIKDVKKGDVVLIKPGETIPVDGEVVFGSSFINESMLTGEPVPTEKITGHKVFAGTVNSSNVIHIKATQTGSTTTLSKIIRYVQEAQGSKAPIQKLVDKISSVFVPLVISIALGSGAIWYFLGPPPQSTYAVLILVTVLIIACPCALGLATPTAIMVGIGRAALQGVLIRDAESLENLKDVEVIFIDKTGTLTEGRPIVDHFSYNEK
ncbi:MAG: heavy metal translocating P-type ATPase, partial [Cyclobacteriaceae bacterium]|nr:heavy metal translocating P-type ATPase [Cyclobacteriaceae bacterium]